MSNLTFSVRGVSETPTRFIAKTRNFTLTIDEPEDLGGSNKGANPVEFLLSGYAGCLNVMGHLIAKELGFQLHQLEINVSGQLNPGRFLGASEEERAGFKQIKVTLIPFSNATPEQLQDWVHRIEKRCPVNDNLSNITPTEITIQNPLAVEIN